jgi:hypothetical protein
MFSVKFHFHDDMTLVESVSDMWLVRLYCLDNDVLSTENSYYVWHIIELCVAVPSLCELSFVFSFMGCCYVKSLLRP